MKSLVIPANPLLWKQILKEKNLSMTLTLVHSQLMTEGSALQKYASVNVENCHLANLDETTDSGSDHHWILKLSGGNRLSISSHWEDMMVTMSTEWSGFTSLIVNQMLVRLLMWCKTKYICEVLMLNMLNLKPIKALALNASLQKPQGTQEQAKPHINHRLNPECETFYSWPAIFKKKKRSWRKSRGGRHFDRWNSCNE